MRLQLLDASAHFECSRCTFCCDQPWRTLIERDKAAVLDGHDFSAYPQLRERPFYRATNGLPEGMFELAKGEGTRCLFLDVDGLCIIHKELGAAAKPNMCRQFPFLSARTWVDDRVSANYGCPAIQKRIGPALTGQAADVAAVVPVSDRPTRPDGRVMLDTVESTSLAAGDALVDRALELFDDRREGDIWQRFADLVRLVAGVIEFKRAQAGDSKSDEYVRVLLVERRLASEGGDALVAVDAAAPMPARFLFAATLYPDTIPVDAAGNLGLFRRLTLAPKLMALSRLSGGYASRLLGRNVSIDAVLRHPVEGGLDDEATATLLRYYRSRFWQRMLIGTRLPFLGGVHQHIHDLNAILFLARAEAVAGGADRLTNALIRQALTRVEFHLANQSRVYDQTLRRWLRARLCDADLALASLRLFAPARAARSSAETSGSPAASRASTLAPSGRSSGR